LVGFQNAKKHLLVFDHSKIGTEIFAKLDHFIQKKIILMIFFIKWSSFVDHLKDGQILRFSNGLVFGCSVLPEKDNLNT
jgi:hypothetical protein